MPKLKPREAEQKARITRAYISKNMELLGKTEEEVAAKMHIAKRTLQNKRKDPRTFTLGELWKLCEVLNFSEDEKAQVL